MADHQELQYDYAHSLDDARPEAKRTRKEAENKLNGLKTLSNLTAEQQSEIETLQHIIEGLRPVTDKLGYVLAHDDPQSIRSHRLSPGTSWA